MKKKREFSCYILFLGGIIAFLIIARIILYIPVSISHCSSSSEYKDGYCIFDEINDRYTILNKQYFGRSGIFEMLGIVQTKPVYLFDNKENKIIKKGEIGWWVSSSDLEISNNELYFKSNYGGFIFSTYYSPSLKKPWIIRNDITQKRKQ